MQQHNINTLNEHYHHWQTLRDAGYLRGLSAREKDDMLRVGREEFFGPKYSPDMFCSHCVGQFVRDVYTRFDEFLTVHKNFPKHDQ